MGNLTTATTFIVLLNVLMWFSTIGMLTVNPTGTFCYNTEGSIIASATTNLTVVDTDILEQLPEQSASSGVFTDIFNNINTWFKTAPGIKYIYGVVAAPYNILTCANLPVEFVVGIGTLWYMVTFLVFISFLWGRD